MGVGTGDWYSGMGRLWHIGWALSGLLALAGGPARASEGQDMLDQGWREYGFQSFEEARKRFTQAEDQTVDDAMLTLAAGLVHMDSEYVKDGGTLMSGYAIASIPMVLIFLFTMRLFVKGLSSGAVKG